MGLVGCNWGIFISIVLIVSSQSGTVLRDWKWWSVDWNTEDDGWNERGDGRDHL